MTTPKTARGRGGVTSWPGCWTQYGTAGSTTSASPESVRFTLTCQGEPDILEGMESTTYTFSTKDLDELTDAANDVITADQAINDARGTNLTNVEVMDLQIAATKAQKRYSDLFQVIAMQAAGPRLDRNAEQQAKRDLGEALQARLGL